MVLLRAQPGGLHRVRTVALIGSRSIVVTRVVIGGSQVSANRTVAATRTMAAARRTASDRLQPHCGSGDTSPCCGVRRTDGRKLYPSVPGRRAAFPGELPPSEAATIPVSSSIPGPLLMIALPLFDAQPAPQPFSCPLPGINRARYRPKQHKSCIQRRLGN